MAKTRIHNSGIEARSSAIRITFWYRESRCRETLPLAPTSANLLAAGRLREEILRKIALGSFDYLVYFPESKHAKKLFGERVPAQSMPTFQMLSDQWIAIKRDECQYSTAEGYLDSLKKHLLPTLGERPIDNILYSELASMISKVSWKNSKTRNNTLIPLRGVFELAVRDGLLQDNPARHIQNKKLQKEPPDPLSLLEMERVLAYMRLNLPELAMNYFEFACTAGPRTSEIIALQWKDVDFIKRTVTIRRARVRQKLKPTKTFQVREIEMNSRALSVLERQLKLTFREDDEEAFIFINPITNIYFLDDQTPRKSYWYPTLDALKIRRRPAYNTRHTFATLALMAGANPMWVARQLGHTSMKMLLEVYAKWIDDSDDSRERNKLDQLFANAPLPPQMQGVQEGKLNENNIDTGGEGGIRTRVRILS